MANPQHVYLPLTVEEYLEYEQRGDIRYEYVAGAIFAMTGGTLRHNIIALDIFAALAPARGGSCRVFVNDVKVRAADDTFYYPDVVVACGPLDDRDVSLTAPCLVVEVTSPSTFRTDRSEKLLAYRTITSLQTYLIVEQEERLVEHHWRDETGTWQRAVVTGNESITLGCPELVLALDDIYDRVEFATQHARLRVREAAAVYD